MKNIALSLLALLTFTTSSISTKATKTTTRYNLFEAVQAEDRKEVRKLLKQGAEVNVLNNEGKTALDVAVDHGYFKIARNLISHGGKVTNAHNVRMIKNMFEKRAFKFLMVSLFIVPILFVAELLLGACCSLVLLTILPTATAHAACGVVFTKLFTAIPYFMGLVAFASLATASIVQASKACTVPKPSLIIQ